MILVKVTDTQIVTLDNIDSIVFTDNWTIEFFTPYTRITSDNTTYDIFEKFLSEIQKNKTFIDLQKMIQEQHDNLD